MRIPLILALASALAAIGYGVCLITTILKRGAGDSKMREIAQAIELGAKAYLNRQYKTIAPIAAILFFALWWLVGLKSASGFLLGSVLSALQERSSGQPVSSGPARQHVWRAG